MVRISISATNPCHLYDFASALYEAGALGRFYSGYPAWRLNPPAGFPIVAHAMRTLVTYSCLRLPANLRPASHRLFRWQDRGFDRAVAGSLDADPANSIHAMPGQALETFRGARSRGMKTILNHASGPVRQQLQRLKEEYLRAGVPLADHHGFDPDYFRREQAEYDLADRHCVASSLVRNQLVAEGVALENIWVVPYGADATRFFPPPARSVRERGRIVFAGQVSLRKGLRVAFAAMQQLAATDLTLEIFGRVSPEMQPTLAKLGSPAWLRLQGTISQTELGTVFRRAAMLVLPSWEEAFGLVVVQALNCGLPCIVSDRVGALDLIRHRKNGSIFPAGDEDALAREIEWWHRNPETFVDEPHRADASARALIGHSATL